MRVLVAEDDPTIAQVLLTAIQEAGYETQVVADGPSALVQTRTQIYDLILLDIMLPGLSGVEVCRQARARGTGAKIIMITARDAVSDKVVGLDAGADDYLVKPFEVAELLARMRVLLRRSGMAEYIPLQVADLKLDPATRCATRGGTSIPLAVTEYALLECLMRRPHTTVTRATLLEQVWQYDFENQTGILDRYISYLRAKVDRGHSLKLIHTVRGVGYRVGSPREGP